MIAVLDKRGCSFKFLPSGAANELTEFAFAEGGQEVLHGKDNSYLNQTVRMITIMHAAKNQNYTYEHHAFAEAVSLKGVNDEFDSCR